TSGTAATVKTPPSPPAMDQLALTSPLIRSSTGSRSSNTSVIAFLKQPYPPTRLSVPSPPLCEAISPSCSTTTATLISIWSGKDGSATCSKPSPALPVRSSPSPVSRPNWPRITASSFTHPPRPPQSSLGSWESIARHRISNPTASPLLRKLRPIPSTSIILPVVTQ